MQTETFYTLSEYKLNYKRLLNEFMSAYEDNDAEGFISLQIQWYQKCLENTKLASGVFLDGMGLRTKPMMSNEDYLWEVNEKIKNESGMVDKHLAQNLNISFSKIISFLENVVEPKSTNNFQLSAAQAILFHYVLQEAKLEPQFPAREKGKCLEELAKRYGGSPGGLKKKYNLFLKDRNKAYSEEDAIIVQQLIKISHPKLLPKFRDITKHYLI